MSVEVSSKKLTVALPSDPAIPESLHYRDAYIPVFTAALFTIFK